VKEVPLSEVKDDLSRYLREATQQQIVITRHGKPAGVLIGFKSEEDWFDYRLENDPRFLERISKARPVCAPVMVSSWKRSSDAVQHCNAPERHQSYHLRIVSTCA
jgi:prevent-host-death family protein